MDKNQEHAIQTQQKFEFYFFGLVFTVLGLSVQTSQFSSDIQASCEIAAWAALLVSGLAGLSRMEWIPVLYGFDSDHNTEGALVRRAEQGGSFIDESGRVLSSDEIGERVKRAHEHIRERQAVMTGIERKGATKYWLHKWMFVAGLVLLIVSRSVVMLSNAGTASQ
jgi:hypothetical protein